MPKHFRGLLSRSLTRSIDGPEDEDEVDTDVLPADEDISGPDQNLSMDT